MKVAIISNMENSGLACAKLIREIENQNLQSHVVVQKKDPFETEPYLITLPEITGREIFIPPVTRKERRKAKRKNKRNRK